ncbi:O-antigen ligase [Neptuniibacter sp. 2_MG-2023]|uniref:O-antigen ligase family protein n=1 Tax=Neptuniibacter sp. 2_MG-2023 TaxID=3062671 RepID=UPI0026E4677F|nr:O-antigen ligase family protein [Neptuniibacter sp. 2_MG-2023]MDO6514985.1 O-antigen ligase family protein [Neptuniibacter sp. 2_MG-2023]
MSFDNSESTQAQPILLNIGAWLLIAGVFSIPLLGNAAHNLLLGLPIILLLCTKSIKQYPYLLKSNRMALFSTLLFLWLGVSIFWSNAETNYSVKILSKYREFLLIPLFMIYFSIDKYRKNAVIALYMALLFSLFISYLIHYDLVDYWDNSNSIKNRIFHGISMSIFAYINLQAGATSRKYRAAFIAIFIITFHNLFFIENGRIGYILICTLTALFGWQQWRIKGLIGMILIGSLTATSLILFADLSHLRIMGHLDAISDANEITLSVLQQADIRLEFYILSLYSFMDSWLLGHGLGSFPAVYAMQHEAIQTYWEVTVNSHNEFLQISVQTGIIGLMLFISFLISLLLKRKGFSPLQQQCQTALFITFGITCMFNSSFMDHGDGTLFMILAALIAGIPWKTEPKDTEEPQQS